MTESTGTTMFAIIVVAVSSFIAGYACKEESEITNTTYSKDIFAIDEDGLLDDLEQAYILENFETNTLVVFDEKNGYMYNEEATKVGEEMRGIYSQILNRNKVELKTK